MLDGFASLKCHVIRSIVFNALKSFSGVLTCVVTVQVRATDQGSPPRSSTARLDVEWMSRPPPLAEPIAFDEPHFTFAVMETEPVTHMVGIIMMESGGGPYWFDIIGKREGTHAHAHTHKYTWTHGCRFSTGNSGVQKHNRKL